MTLNNQQINAIAFKINQELSRKISEFNATLRQEINEWFPENWETAVYEIEQLNSFVAKYKTSRYGFSIFITPESWLDNMRTQRYNEEQIKASHNLDMIKSDVIIASMDNENVDNLISTLIEKYIDAKAV